jgi:hypothetical protein
MMSKWGDLIRSTNCFSSKKILCTGPEQKWWGTPSHPCGARREKAGCRVGAAGARADDIRPRTPVLPAQRPPLLRTTAPPSARLTPGRSGWEGPAHGRGTTLTARRARAGTARPLRARTRFPEKREVRSYRPGRRVCRPPRPLRSSGVRRGRGGLLGGSYLPTPLRSSPGTGHCRKEERRATPIGRASRECATSAPG